MNNVIFIAPPAAGKGTQSRLLEERLNYLHVSTGDLLREESKKNTPLGEEINQTMQAGNLVPSEIISKLMNQIIKETTQPIVFDGYPRNMSQAKSLEDILKKENLKIYKVILLNVSKEEALKRSSARLGCNSCGKTYHKYVDQLKPIQDGICDNCLTPLTLREDDTKETFEKRYNTYLNETIPLIKYYEEKGNLHIIDNPEDPEETFMEVERILK